MSATVTTRTDGRVTVVTIERPERRNAVDLPTAWALYDAFRAFDADAGSDVAVLTGAGGAFCAGADLVALAAGETRPVEPEGDFGPMGPTRLALGKPVIAAVEGPAVAGGMELALWCDLRIAGRSAVFGLYNRRFGVPLIDLGTIRLPRIVGHGRALELILTGRPVGAEEALRIGLVNEVTEDGEALARATALAHALSAFPQTALRNDRLSAIEQWGLGGPAAVANEVARGLATIASGEMREGSSRFAGGAGRHGAFSSGKSPTERRVDTGARSVKPCGRPTRRARQWRKTTTNVSRGFGARSPGRAKPARRRGPGRRRRTRPPKAIPGSRSACGRAASSSRRPSSAQASAGRSTGSSARTRFS